MSEVMDRGGHELHAYGVAEIFFGYEPIEVFLLPQIFRHISAEQNNHLFDGMVSCQLLHILLHRRMGGSIKDIFQCKDLDHTAQPEIPVAFSEPAPGYK